jgi:hypothetical protein
MFLHECKRMYMHLRFVRGGAFAAAAPVVTAITVTAITVTEVTVAEATVTEVTFTEVTVTRGHHLQLSDTLQCLLDAVLLLLLDLGLCSTLLLVQLLQNLCLH